MEYLFGILALVTGSVLAQSNVDQNVKIVNVVRFDGELEYCQPGEVCADVFNFTRTNEDGSGRLESRFIQNCQCENVECGRTGNQLMFKETRTQSMVTCEDASDFHVCEPGEIAKEQHNVGYYVYYKINCVCPNNENPGNFRSKMTVPKPYYLMDDEERAYAEEHPRSRFFTCREDRVSVTDLF